MSEIIPKADLLEHLDDLISDNEYKKEKARLQGSKRNAQRAITFFASIKFHILDNAD